MKTPSKRTLLITLVVLDVIALGLDITRLVRVNRTTA